jgi:hypothetical protein
VTDEQKYSSMYSLEQTTPRGTTTTRRAVQGGLQLGVGLYAHLRSSSPRPACTSKYHVHTFLHHALTMPLSIFLP